MSLKRTALLTVITWLVIMLTMANFSAPDYAGSLPFQASLGIHNPNSVAWGFPGEKTGSVQLRLDQGDSQIRESVSRSVLADVQKYSLPVLEHNAGQVPVQTTQLIAFNTDKGYLRSIRQIFPKNEITNASGQTAGFTLASEVFLPMYEYQNQAYLVNTLTHELTHVVLNQQHIGAVLPTWMNEGFAWYDGMTAERMVSAADAAQLENLLQDGINRAVQTGELLPLTASESDILRVNHIYNVEFEDYLAVKHLIDRYGLAKFRAFLNASPQGVAQSFYRQYHMPLSQYQTQFFQHMMDKAH
ncbi:hypothetical protein LLE49_03175 [Alicyclobacillus tolerans]|uniref:peptidase MA family metallohydrolase n=1 Tax=Alicyclobacillus tolerans TaxID=90970 RepID=UPI001F2DE42C|nr:hypothetical protein [Alicyclobacillus tolerans]MCF8563740.1 hypothetical protein [Alicyclobacillus tolerans]